MEVAMKSAREIFDNSFDLPLVPAEAWPVLMDIRRIAPFMPGVALAEVVDDETYQGSISVPLGPVTLTFSGVMKFEEVDPVNHAARITAQGANAEGLGGACATASFRLEPEGDGSKVLVHTNLALSGAAAQYGFKIGIMQATATQIIAQFADNLRAQFVAPPPPADASSLRPRQAADQCPIGETS
jgi:hypothetical protein